MGSSQVTLTLQALQELGVTDVFLCPVPKSLAVAFAPRVHLAVFCQSNGELTPTPHFDDVQVLKLFDQLGRFAAVTTTSAQLPVVAVSPGPHLTWKYKYV